MAEEGVQIPVSIDTSKVGKDIGKLTGKWSKSMRDIQAASDKSMKGAGSAITKYHNIMGGAIKKHLPLMEKVLKQGKKHFKMLEGERKSLKEVIKNDKLRLAGLHKQVVEIEKLEKKTDEQKKALKEYATLQKKIDQQTKARSGLKASQDDLISKTKQQVEELKLKMEPPDFDELYDVAKAAGDEIAGPFQSLLAKDLPGAMEKSVKLIGAGVKMAQAWKEARDAKKAKAEKKQAQEEQKKQKGGGGLLEKIGKAGKAGAELKGGGAAKAVAGGGAGGAGGAGLQALAKLGPVIASISAVVIGLVKLFLDAEATVKEINKEVLATTGTADILARNFGNAQAASAELDKTLKGISKAALSLDNIEWGISKEQHTQVISALTAEGVSLKNLENSYGGLTRSTNAYSDSIGAITQMAVVYSRTLGVSLQDITSLQSEMMTEMGMNVTQVQQTFSTMGKDAAESGMAANKFFNIIRGVSADLSLYNNRMEDAVKLLKVLGQVMSAKSAQKFMSTAMNAVKGMGRIQRLQTTLLAGGGEVAKIVGKDIEDTQRAVAKSISGATGESVENVKKILQSGVETDIDAMMDKVKAAKPEMVGELREAISKMQIKQEMSKKGVYGVAQAAGETGPAAQLAVLDKALSKWGGVGSIGGEQMAENLGVSRETLDQMTMFKKSMEVQRRVLKKNLPDIAAKAAAGDETAKEQLAKLKEQGITAEDASSIDKAGYQQLFNAMDEGSKAQLEGVKSDAEMAKEQAKKTSTIMDKLSTLVDWFMGQFYNVIMGIYETILKVPGLGDSKKSQEIALIKTIQGMKDPELSKAMLEAGGDMSRFVDSFTSGKGFKDVVAKMGAGGAGDVRAKLEEAASPEAIRKAITDAGVDVARQGNADTEVYNSKLDKMQTRKGTGEDKAKLLESIKNLDPEKQTKILEKLGLNLEPEKLVKVFAGATKEEAEKPGAPEAPKPAMPAQQAAAAKVEAPSKAEVAAAPMAPAPAKAQVAAPASPKAPEPTKVDEAQEKLLDAQAGTLDNIFKALRVRGIRIDTKTMGSSSVKDAVYEASSKAILEYWVYSQLGGTKVAEGIKGGKTAQELAQQALTGAKTTGKFDIDNPAPANDAGGIVSAIQGGMAQVQPAPGEGLASIGRGEQIVPAGKGGRGNGPQKVIIEFRGDAGRLFDAKVDEGYARNRGREKY